MRWIPAGLIGVAAALAGLTFGAIDGSEQTLTSAVVTPLAVIVWGGALVLLPLAILAWTIRRVDLRSDAAEWRTMLDLGADRASIVRHEAATGVRQGAIASGVGVVLGLTLTMTLPYYQPADGGLRLPSFLSLGGLLVTYALLILATGAVHGLAALTETRPGPRPGVPARAAVPGEGSLARRGGTTPVLVVQLVAFGLSIGILAVQRVAGRPSDSLSETTSAWLNGTLGVATLVAAVSGIALAARVISRTTIRVAHGIAAGAARVQFRGARGLGLAARIAADSLAHRTTTRALAAGAMGGVLALAALVSVPPAIDEAEQEVTARFQIEYTVATGSWWFDEDLPAETTVAKDALDPDLVTALGEDPLVIAIPYGIVSGVPARWADGWYYGTEDGTPSDVANQTFMVVYPGDLDALSPGGLTPLGFQDGTFTEGSLSSWTETASADVEPVDLFHLEDARVGSFVTRAWAEEQYGEIPIVGVLLWLSDEGVAAADPEDPHALIREILDENGADDLWALGTDYGEQWGTTVTFDSVPVVWLLMIVGVGLTLALASASVRDRRREIATLAALGASPRALRLAPAVEVAATVVAAALVGIPSGTLAALVSSHPTLLGAGAPFNPGTSLWIMGWDLAHASFLLPLAVAAFGLLLSVLAALTLGASMTSRTPVEEIRTADKEGVR